MFQLPSTERVHIGKRVSAALIEEIDYLGANRIFLLVSSALRKNTTEIDKVCDALGSRVVSVYDGIPPHAPRSSILTAASEARTSEADLIVTIGGGSVTDAGKIIPLILKYEIEKHDDLDPFHIFVDESGSTIKPTFEGPDLRVICCPTTLSGGEFNTLSGATNEKIGHKQGFEHPMMAPVAVVLDPQLALHTPDWLWMSTGVRAVDHTLETLGSFESDHFSDGIAESALRLLSQALPNVRKNPDDLDARLRCQIGAWQSMIPIIGGVPMGASHAIGHILGGTCDVPHGYCSCVMAPAVLHYNYETNSERQRRISSCFGMPDEPAEGILDQFISDLGMPRALSEVGVSTEKFDHIAEYTMMDFWIRTNPKEIKSPLEVMEILNLAV